MMHRQMSYARQPQAGEHPHLLLFGSMKLSNPPKGEMLPNSRNARLLLAYLLLHHSTPIHRYQLVNALWPDRTEARSRRALSQALWLLRQQWPHAVQATPETLCLSPNAPFQSDVEELERLWLPYLENPNTNDHASLHSQKALEKGLDLYKGPLLEEFYDGWVLSARQKWHNRYLQVLGKLLLGAKQQQDFERALAWSLRLIQEDSLNETWYMEAMRLHHLLGQPQQALQLYQDWEELKQREALAASASEVVSEVTRLAQTILDQNQTTLTYLPQKLAPLEEAPFLQKSSLELVGRKTERARLVLAWNQTSQGQGGLVYLEGAAGIGKSRLLEEFARDVEWRGGAMFQGQCSEPWKEVPMGVVSTAIGSNLTPLRAEQLGAVMPAHWLRLASQLVPELGDWLPQTRLYPTLPLEQKQSCQEHTLTHLLLGLSQLSPLVLVLEDISSVDPATLSWLEQFLPHLHKHPILVVLSMCPQKVREQPVIWDQLLSWSTQERTLRISLPALTQEQSRTLLQQALGSPVRWDDGLHKLVFAQTKGHPQSMLATLRAWYNSNVLYRNEANAWQCSPQEANTLPCSVSVNKAFQQQFQQLLPLSQQTVRNVAFLGPQATFSQLVAQTKATPATLLATLRSLVQKQWLCETHRHYEFVHPLWQKMVEATLSEQQSQPHQQMPSHRKEFGKSRSSTVGESWVVRPSKNQQVVSSAQACTTRLPRRNAPTGRPLHEDEWVEVTWTLHTAEDDSITSKVSRRHTRILRLLHEAQQQEAAPTLQDLAEALQVSKRTIKRDLAKLRQQGKTLNTRRSPSFTET